MGEPLLYSIKEKIAVMEINRPPFNPLNEEIVDIMMSFLEELYKHDDAHVLVIKGSGEKAFSAGADIHQFVPRLGKKDLSLTANFHQAFDLLNELSIPVIAALKGHVLGGGLELALAADFRICDENTKFGLPEINLGIIPGAGGTQRLPRLIGQAKAMEMMMFGTSITAEEALQYCLVNKVVPVGEVENKAMEWANILKNKSKTALSSIKKSVRYGINLPLLEGLKFERTQFAELFATKDAKEGVMAFLEKREPKFNQ